ncbi:DUF456 domain-containing protein [Staphylococcus sp. IVB6181]|uniref:DUF456 domain-containing protein n=1 Tax=Staphylococcus TaxID=1279 RepID=UPI000DF814D6|nr:MULTISPECIES: DUF456 domain-containing protein [Staphylococcus]MCD8914082.1 DUF456 domain-containing protein [Staphylococcus simulans]UXV34662.1 DUF456 domain-containing protein [Staphylococcus sp. IVB6181]
MVATILWLFIIACFVIAFIGLVKPVIPSMPVMWIGFLIYQIGFHNGKLSWVFYISMIILTIFIFLADLMMSQYFTRRFGGSKAGEITALIGVILGCFIFPPFGIILVPLIAVFVVEMILQKDPATAIKASFGSVVGFLASTAAQAIVMIIMVVWFFLAILIN